MNLLDASDSKNGESAFSKFIDFAYATHTFTPSTSLSTGQIVAELGGREGNANPGDFYYASPALADLNSKSGSALWPVGEMLPYQMSDQKVDLTIANTTFDDASSQHRIFYGATYTGTFADKFIRPILGYHRDEESKNTTSKSYLSVGIRLNFTTIEWDIDYLLNSYNYSVWSANTTKAISSIVTSLRFKATEWLHFVAKLDVSSGEKASTGGTAPTFSTTSYLNESVAVEYYPIENAKIRYHLAFDNKETTPDGSSTTTENNILAGIRINHDLLK